MQGNNEFIESSAAAFAKHQLRKQQQISIIITFLAVAFAAGWMLERATDGKQGVSYEPIHSQICH